MTEPIKPVSVPRRVIAVILDLFTTFIIFGWVIAYFSNNTTENGFSLDGGPAIILFVVTVAYFFIGRRYAGGTLWDRILGIGRPQPY